jgi:pimeloyl-ACP methyl ester carboxylesterase
VLGRVAVVKRVLIVIGAFAPVLVLAAFGLGLWAASTQLLAPSFRGVERDLSVCKQETEVHWGPRCGNLRETHQFVFSEVQIPTQQQAALPGWLITSDANGFGPARGAIMLVHAGGSDRREDTRYVPFYLSQGLDVLTFDLDCHGEAACPTYGLTYGERESNDVRAAYSYLRNSYSTVYAFGSSVGAAAILVALPDTPDLSGAVVENPMHSVRRLIKEAPEAQAAPGWFTDLLLDVAMWRGGFDGHPSPADSVPLARAEVPLLFIHSQGDQVVSSTHTQELADLYPGPDSVWLPERGSHAAIWDVEPSEYEQRVAAFLDAAR